MSRKAIALVALFCGAALGLSLPDTDHVFFFLRHRSMVTHSVLFPFLAYYFSRDSKYWVRMGATGLALAITVHLCFDLFPADWRGYALLYIPFGGALPGTMSWLWLFGNMVACWYISFLLLDTIDQTKIALGCTALIFLFASQVERSLWMPLITLVLSGALASFIPNPIINGQDVLRRWMTKAESATSSHH